MTHNEICPHHLQHFNLRGRLSRRSRLWLLALIGVGPLCCLVVADVVVASERVRLQLNAKPGETYRTEIIKKSSLTVAEIHPDIPISHEVFRMLIEGQVHTVRPDGAMVLRERVLEYSSQLRQLLNTKVFDSTNPAHIEAARKDPAMAPILAFLSLTTQIEVEPTGDIRDFELFWADSNVYPSVQATMEDMVAQPLVILPDHDVAIMDTWDAGEVSSPLAWLGRIYIKLEGIFLDVHVEAGEKIAFIGISGTVKLEPDPDSADRVELTGFKYEGLVRLSIQQGRKLWSKHKYESTLKIIDQKGFLEGRMVVETVYRDVR